MQANSDIFLVYESVEGDDGVKRDFYVRQLRDGKGSANVELMDPSTLAETYADQNERDDDALVAAEADGRVSVLRGV